MSSDDDFVFAHNDPTSDAVYETWTSAASAQFSVQEVFAADALRAAYPKHSLVLTTDYSFNLLSYPDLIVEPLNEGQLVDNVRFAPLARRSGPFPGVLIDTIVYGAFKVHWQKYELLYYSMTFPSGMGRATQHILLHDGPETVARNLMFRVGLFANTLHNEIWMFNSGYWQKNAAMWAEVQKADWKDVVLKDHFKKALQKDVYGFFDSEEIYKKLSIPWKRGLIMYGPPGNGKTISLKAIMKTCMGKGFNPLYVKSFQSYKGEEGAMEDVFNHARSQSPCLVILEDLDSLINDRNRSFFLNQLDGLEGNDGLLIIGTTNHFDKLDPALSTRPSRFDRKYLFDDPDREERALYVRYWQKKLQDNKKIDFPDELVDEVADATTKFSFAYLKEAFVATLVQLVSDDDDDDKPSFSEALMDEIHILRKQLDKDPSHDITPFDIRNVFRPAVPAARRASPPSLADAERGIQRLANMKSAQAPQINTYCSLKNASSGKVPKVAPPPGIFDFASLKKLYSTEAPSAARPGVNRSSYGLYSYGQ